MSGEFLTVDISNRQPVASSTSSRPPHLGWVAIKDLVIDTSYQRDLHGHSWKHIRAIAENFDWNKFSAVEIAPADGEGMKGKYAIIDGQHRVHAAALVGLEKVPASIKMLTRAGQAEAFAHINGSVTAMTAFHVYKAALAACEKWAVAARDICEAAGCRLMTNNFASSDRKPRQIFTIQLVRTFAERPGLHAALYAGLASLAQAKQGAHVAVWGGHVLRQWLMAVEDRNDLWSPHKEEGEKLCWRALAHALDRHIDLYPLWNEAQDLRRERALSGKWTQAARLYAAAIEEKLAAALPDRRAMHVAADEWLQEARKAESLTGKQQEARKKIGGGK